MISDIMTTLQGMNNTALIVIFVCAGIGYFKFIRPELQDAKTLRKAQFQKIEHIPSGEDVQKMMDGLVAIVATSMKENISVVNAADMRINTVLEHINTLQKDFADHVSDSTDESNDRSIRIEDLMKNSDGTEALIEYLITELSKSGMIGPTDVDHLQALKNKATASRHSITNMMALYNQQTITNNSRISKLNRIVNTRV